MNVVGSYHEACKQEKLAETKMCSFRLQCSGELGISPVRVLPKVP